METKKEKTEKEQVKAPKALSYEELQRVAAELQQQNMSMRRELQKRDYEIAFRRLDYLFRVLSASSHINFSPDFLTDCIKEVETSLTIPADLKKSEKN